MKRLKADEVTCPAVIKDKWDILCGSSEIHFDRPIWKDREYEDVTIPCRCDTCGHMFNVTGHIVITRVE